MNRPANRDPLGPPHLLDAAVRGDVAAIDALARHLTPRLRELARQLGAPAHAIDEVVQDTLLVVVSGSAPRNGIGALDAWLATIVHHRVVDLRRIAQRRSRLHRVDTDRVAGSTAPAAESDGFRIARSREVIDRVRAAVAELPEPYRECLALQLFSGLSPLEIARRLQLHRVTVRLRLFRGLRMLRRHLPDTLALLLLLGLSRHGRAQVSTATVAAASVFLLGASSATIYWSTSATAPEPAVALAATPATPAATIADVPLERRQAPNPVATAHTVVVHVVDGDGADLAGVGIEVAPASGIERAAHVRREVTGANGRATFPLADAASLRIRSDRGHDRTIPAGAATIELACDAGIDVSGRVIDDAGRAVAGAAIWLATTPADVGAGADVAFTASDGTFALRQVPNDTAIAVRADGFDPTLPLRVQRGEPIIVVLANGGGTLDGEVLDDAGAPIADALVTIGAGSEGVSARVAARFTPELAPPQSVRTDARGRFRVHGLAAGDQPLLVRMPGFVPFCTAIHAAPADTTTVAVRLQRGAIVTGRVNDENGSPVAGARVTCTGDATYCSAEVIADGDGNFCFRCLPTGQVLMTARAAAFDSTDLSPMLRLGRQQVEITLAQLGVRHGRIVDAADRPLADWEIGLPAAHGRSIETDTFCTAADESGSVELTVARGTDWNDLMLRPAGSKIWRRAAAFSNDLADGSFLLRVPEDAMPTASLRVRLTAVDGSPIAGAPIWLPVSETGPLVLGTTDRNGSLTVKHLTAGRYELAASSRDADVAVPELPVIDLAAGEQRTIAARCPPTGILRYRLRRSDGGIPLAPQVRIERVGNTTPIMDRQGAAGTQRLPAGSYVLHAVGADFVWYHTAPIAIAEGGTVDLDCELRAATRRLLSLRAVPPECRRGHLVGKLVDADTGERLYQFDVPLDAAELLPLASYLPAGNIRLEGTTGTGHRLTAAFSLGPQEPLDGALPLRFEVTAPVAKIDQSGR